MGLTVKQQAYCRGIAEGLSMSAAGKKAGYSTRGTIHRAAALPHVKEEIRRLTRASCERSELTMDMVTQELMLIAFSDGTEVFPRIVDGKIVPPDLNSLTEAQRRNIQEVHISKNGVKVSRYDKIKALELLGKRLGMWVEKHEVTGAEGGPLVVVQEAPKA